MCIRRLASGCLGGCGLPASRPTLPRARRISGTDPGLSRVETSLFAKVSTKALPPSACLWVLAQGKRNGTVETPLLSCPSSHSHSHQLIEGGIIHT